jgi:ribosomal protein S18 acetylase RimI-like enzyme
MPPAAALTIRAESPRHPQATALLQASHAYLQSLYDPEDNYFLSIDALCAPQIRFFVAESGGTLIGTAALALKPGYAEVKSMFVSPEARGLGAAKALLARLEAEARASGLTVLMLETGPRNTEALALYQRFGFSRRGPFGDYPDSAASLFLELPLLPHRLSPGDDMAPVLALLHQAFAYMEGVIDPPSSLMRMGVGDLQAAARDAELWVIGAQPLACMILTPQADTLYLGKLAVQDMARGRGLARVMTDHALMRARALGLASVTLQTRVELTANHAAFTRMGFVEINRTAHAGYAQPTSITYQKPV